MRRQSTDTCAQGARRRADAVNVARRTLICLIAVALALVVAAPASARRAGPVVGLGEQQAAMFTSKWFKRLEMRDARYLAPWDVLQDPHQLSLLDTWMAAARQAHVRVVLGFGHSFRTQRLARTLPSWRQFRSQFKAVGERYPWVHDFIVWNEANNPGALTANRPRRAAQYFDVAASSCRGCRLVAADLLDTSNMIPWAREFRRYARHTPRIWGLHNYGDANRMSVKNTRKLLSVTRGQIWFTETGGVVLRRVYRGKRVLHTYRYGARHAAAATKHALQLACLSKRITRVYLYDWLAPPKVTTWDSGMLDARGRRRPAYSVLRRWLDRSAQASRHGGRRALCGR
jgi:polysaccharide biosynthesis protein PslG